MPSAERRHTARLRPTAVGLLPHAIVRPGHDVRVLNVSAGGALVECGARLRPGSATELQVSRGGVRISLRARVRRCRVCRLAPLVYEAALSFDQALDVGVPTP